MTIKEGEMRGTWRCCRQAKMQTEKKKKIHDTKPQKGRNSRGVTRRECGIKIAGNTKVNRWREGVTVGLSDNYRWTESVHVQSLNSGCNSYT